MTPSLAFWVWPVAAAPFVGSFLGVVIRRLPERRPLTLARSECENCRRALQPWEMVPLASWFALRGRCASCGARIAAFHPAVELAALLVALGAAWAYAHYPVLLWISCGLGWGLLALAWIDWERFRLPDALTLPLIVAGLVVTWRLDRNGLLDHVVATAAGYLSLWLLNVAYRKLRGFDGLGEGDAKLFAACGAWVGLAGLPPILLLAALTGLALAGLKALGGHQLVRTTPVPFGTSLAVALWLQWLAGGWLL